MNISIEKDPGAVKHYFDGTTTILSGGFFRLIATQEEIDSLPEDIAKKIVYRREPPNKDDPNYKCYFRPNNKWYLLEKLSGGEEFSPLVLTNIILLVASDPYDVHGERAYQFISFLFSKKIEAGGWSRYEAGSEYSVSRYPSGEVIIRIPVEQSAALYEGDWNRPQKVIDLFRDIADLDLEITDRPT